MQLLPDLERLPIILDRLVERALRHVAESDLRVGARQASAVADCLPEGERRLRSLQGRGVVVVVLEVAEREQGLRPTALVSRLLAQSERLAQGFIGMPLVLDDLISRGQSVQAVNFYFGRRRLLEQGQGASVAVERVLRRAEKQLEAARAVERARRLQTLSGTEEEARGLFQLSQRLPPRLKSDRAVVRHGRGLTRGLQIVRLATRARALREAERRGQQQQWGARDFHVTYDAASSL